MEPSSILPCYRFVINKFTFNAKYLLMISFVTKGTQVESKSCYRLQCSDLICILSVTLAAVTVNVFVLFNIGTFCLQFKSVTVEYT